MRLGGLVPVLFALGALCGDTTPNSTQTAQKDLVLLQPAGPTQPGLAADLNCNGFIEIRPGDDCLDIAERAGADERQVTKWNSPTDPRCRGLRDGHWGCVSVGPNFDKLRLRWRELILETDFPADSEPFAARLASLGRQAARHRDSFAPTTGQLWADLPYMYADVDINPGNKSVPLCCVDPDVAPEDESGPTPAVDTDVDSEDKPGPLPSADSDTNAGDKPRPPSSAVTRTFERLLIMANAWAQRGTGLTGDSGLLAVILEGLDRLQGEVYNDSQTMYGNWWDWKIGIPRALMDLCALLDGHLGADRVAGLVAANDHFVPNSAVASYRGTSTAANRVDLCRSIVFSGIFGSAPARLDVARDALPPVFDLVTSGDGFYADGSFVQHGNVPYTGTYGAEMIKGLAGLIPSRPSSTTAWPWTASRAAPSAAGAGAATTAAATTSWPASCC
ncbi:hypothetical protein CDD83_4882 [Cordyceps sp. RAO-2017]|nr:hypothetical protein CDD83_4882 [Cordyceps sp. RAO-2017]